MREYRGKRLDGKGWAYGQRLKNKLGTYIVTEENPHECTQYGYITVEEYHKVDPSTVGQYTGLKDRNGKEIYEGDRVRKIYRDYLDANSCTSPLEVGSEWDGGIIISIDVDEDEDGWASLVLGGQHDVVTLERFRFWLRNENFGWEGEDLQDPSDYEVIGSIHDNPDLLEVTV